MGESISKYFSRPRIGGLILIDVGEEILGKLVGLDLLQPDVVETCLLIELLGGLEVIGVTSLRHT